MYRNKHKNNPSITSPEIARQKKYPKIKKIHNSKTIKIFAKVLGTKTF